MLNIESLYKISYGLYIVCSGDKSKGNGFISNTVFQVTSEPAKFAACCNKNNFTCSMIDQYGVFSVSILSQRSQPEIIRRFGFKSGKDSDKLSGMDIIYGTTGVPIVQNDCIAFLECKVLEKFDVGTHILFIGELIDAQMLNETDEPLTYGYYREIRKGSAPINAPTYIDKSKYESKEKKGRSYKCTCCGYIYNEAMENNEFANLDNDWKCPVCSADKNDFILI